MKALIVQLHALSIITFIIVIFVTISFIYRFKKIENKINQRGIE